MNAEEFAKLWKKVQNREAEAISEFEKEYLRLFPENAWILESAEDIDKDFLDSMYHHMTRKMSADVMAEAHKALLEGKTVKITQTAGK